MIHVADLIHSRCEIRAGQPHALRNDRLFFTLCPVPAGGPPTASGFNKNFRSCGLELDAMGRLNTPVRKQLLAVELTHPEAVAAAAQEAVAAATELPSSPTA